MLSLLWQICAIIGLIFIVTNGQILKSDLTIWSHWAGYSLFLMHDGPLHNSFTTILSWSLSVLSFDLYEWLHPSSSFPFEGSCSFKHSFFLSFGIILKWKKPRSLTTIIVLGFKTETAKTRFVFVVPRDATWQKIKKIVVHADVDVDTLATLTTQRRRQT